MLRILLKTHLLTEVQKIEMCITSPWVIRHNILFLSLLVISFVSNLHEMKLSKSFLHFTGIMG